MRVYDYSDIVLREVSEPEKDWPHHPVELSDKTIDKRKKAVISHMKQRGLQSLVIYATLEHGSNFEYLVGFLPRFEEALLVFHEDGQAFLVLGNENHNKGHKARIENTTILCSYFSLPNQPMQNEETFIDILEKTGISGKRTGVVGWKNFTSKYENNRKMFDIPAYILSALEKLCGRENITNETDLFIGNNGVRIINNANELAHYEFSSSLASDCMLDAMNALKPGITEFEIGEKLLRYGQRTSVVTIAAFGPRFIKGNMYPTDKKLEKGDPVSLTIGYRGGLSSRTGFAAESAADLPDGQKDYFEKVCAPYFTSIRAWLETIHVGMKGGEMYDLIAHVLPKETFHWYLCPGHTTAEEEWMSSPIYAGSEEVMESGEIFETDIIPSVEGYNGVSAESTCAIAAAPLQEEIQREYPEMWRRIENRRKYIKEVLGINLHPNVLPMCSTLGYMRPLALSRKAAIVKKK